MKKRGLGCNLGVLLSKNQTLLADNRISDRIKGQVTTNESAERMNLPLECLRPGAFQPRQNIDLNQLKELAESIKANGVIQPIVVRLIKVGDNDTPSYEIIAGERRWRAAKLAKIPLIPVVIKELTDQAALAMGIIENIQREDLSSLEQAVGLHRLISEFELTHQQIADLLGKSRSLVSNLLRLMNLSPDIKDLLNNQSLEMGHARALLSLNFNDQVRAAQIIIKKKLTVRASEKLVREWLSPPTEIKALIKIDPDHIPHLAQSRSQLSVKLGMPVKFENKNSKQNRVIIQYKSLDELELVLARFS